MSAAAILGREAIKYVVVEHPVWHGLELPIVFPAALSHDLVTKQAKGAGFVCIEGGRVIAHGRSFSLRVDSRPGIDAALLERWCGAFLRGLAADPSAAPVPPPLPAPLSPVPS